ncbi:hypothetical protein COOONC_28387, partial [Cooperia oncophora]
LIFQSDIACCGSRFEHFDFLIDIVPREDSKKIHDELANNSLTVTSEGVIGTPAQVQYVLAGDGASGNDVYHLENGQVGPSAANIDISQFASWNANFTHTVTMILLSSSSYHPASL